MPKKRDHPEEEFRKKYPALEKHIKAETRPGGMIMPSYKT